MLRKILFAFLFIAVMVLPFNGKASAADVYSIIYNEVSSCNGNAVEVEWITQAICYSSSLYQVDPLLVTAVMEQESGFNFDAYSSAGAIGLMQLMPSTAQAVGVDPYNPLSNVVGGVSHLSNLLNSFSGNGIYSTTYALAAYNAGSQAVIDHGGCPPYGETIGYVNSIAAIYDGLINQYYYS